MSRFGGVTLEEASTSWFSKEEPTYNSTNTLNHHSTNTLDASTLTTTHETKNALGEYSCETQR